MPPPNGTMIRPRAVSRDIAEGRRHPRRPCCSWTSTSARMTLPALRAGATSDAMVSCRPCEVMKLTGSAASDGRQEEVHGAAQACAPLSARARPSPSTAGAQQMKPRHLPRSCASSPGRAGPRAYFLVAAVLARRLRRRTWHMVACSCRPLCRRSRAAARGHGRARRSDPTIPRAVYHPRMSPPLDRRGAGGCSRTARPAAGHGRPAADASYRSPATRPTTTA